SIRVGGPARPGVLVVAHFQNEDLDKRTRELDPFGAVAAARKRGEATGEPGRIVEVVHDGQPAAAPKSGRGRAKKAAPTGPTRTFLVGLGAKSKFQINDLRNVAAAIGRRLVLIKEGDIKVELGGVLNAVKADAFAAGVAFGEG